MGPICTTKKNRTHITAHEKLRKNYDTCSYVFDIDNDSAADMLLTLFSAIELMENRALILKHEFKSYLLLVTVRCLYN